MKYVFSLIIILGTIFVIISENRNSVKTIAWCMVLVFMPVIGIILYILLGMDNRNRRPIKEDELNILKERTGRLQKQDIPLSLPEEHSHLATILYNANRAYLLEGHKHCHKPRYRTSVCVPQEYIHIRSRFKKVSSCCISGTSQQRRDNHRVKRQDRHQHL